MEDNIYGSKVFLRPMTLEDTDDIVRWRNKERVRSNFIYQAMFTREGHLNWIQTMIEPGKVIQFMICDAETGQAVGSVYFRDIDDVHRKAEYGIFIGEDSAIGKGFGSEAAKLAIQYGFETMKLHKIMLRVFSHNLSAIKSYENAGFMKEAYLKDEVCINGTFRDLILMGIINPND